VVQMAWVEAVRQAGKIRVAVAMVQEQTVVVDHGASSASVHLHSEADRIPS